MTSRPLELIHMDLLGPTKTNSLSGNHFIFILVDDFSRFTWVFFLEYKDEVFSRFHVFGRRVEKGKNFNFLHKE